MSLTDDELSEEDRAAFKRLADAYEGEPIGELCELVLQSSSEEAN